MSLELHCDNHLLGASHIGLFSVNKPFNPYVIFRGNKVFLTILGDLKAMRLNWSVEEKQARRRLVRFDRQQIDNRIVASFKTITPEELLPDNICISCLWWTEQDGEFVTSTDIIRLLGKLLRIYYTAKEKIRIRRLLQPYGPLTLSKTGESRGFHSSIMDLPHPKPIAIDKDVMMCRWEVLQDALRKVTDKYVAGHASTAALRFGDNGKQASDQK